MTEPTPFLSDPAPADLPDGPAPYVTTDNEDSGNPWFTEVDSPTPGE